MVLHPDSECNSQQAQFLLKCPADQRRFHELLFSYGNSACVYHQRAKNFEPSTRDYEEWLDGLPDKARMDLQKKGFETCKNLLSFTRYVMEKNDVGMEAFIKEKMGYEDFIEYQSYESSHH